MKSIAIAGNSDATLIAVGALAFVGLFLFLKSQGKQAVAAVANVNAGTPYAGAGVVGTLGNFTNQLSGGALGSAGSALGGWLYDTLNPTHKQSVADNSQTATDNSADTFTPDDFGVSGDTTTW